jgi:HlyD family secretion protein
LVVSFVWPGAVGTLSAALNLLNVWRAARAVGDYDLNTFLIRADPVGDTEMLQPGMSVWLHR